ncbi:BQ2448_943 [Microbotryum intermedium]|uniref:BQ2448_943 protein n=1 Tax=Microbotryum intermedium TaxID=269621 RepID=A0A238F486_9BASI|nr:BQ2448_943 [Microbotryum intermedium]
MSSLESAIDLADRVLSRFPDRLTPDNWHAFKTPLEDALRCAKVLRMLQGRFPKPCHDDEDAIEDYASKRAEAKMVLSFCIGDDAFAYIDEEPVEEMWEALVDRFTILSGGRGKTTKLRARKLRQLLDLSPTPFTEGVDLDAYVAQVAELVYQINFLYRQERRDDVKYETRIVPTSYDHDKAPLSPMSSTLDHDGFPIDPDSRREAVYQETAQRLDGGRVARDANEVVDLISADLHRELLHAKLLTDHSLPNIG